MGKIKQLVEDSAELFAKYHPDYSFEESMEFVMNNYPLEHWIKYPDFIKRAVTSYSKIQVNAVWRPGLLDICDYLREHYLIRYINGFVLVESTESGFIVYIYRGREKSTFRNIKNKCNEIEKKRDHYMYFPPNDWCMS